MPTSDDPRPQGLPHLLWLALAAFVIGSGVALGVLPDAARFIAAVALVIWLPGRVLIRAVGLTIDRAEGLALALVVGMLVSGIVYWFFGVFGVPDLFPLWPVAITAYSIVGVRRRVPRVPPWLTRPPRFVHASVAVVAVMAIVPLSFLPMFSDNATSRPDGSVVLGYESDAAFHLAIARELTHNVPPRTIFGPPSELSYHYGSDIVAAMLNRASGVDITDLVLRMLPFFFIALLVLCSWVLARACLGFEFAGVLFAFLVVFGEDFSFIPAVLLGSSGHWTASYFEVPTVFSIYLLNPMLPALAVLFGSILCFRRFVESRQRGWAVLAGFQLALLAEFKIFAAIVTVAALVVVGAFRYLRMRNPDALIVVSLTALFSLPLLALSVLSRPDVSPVHLDLGFSPLVANALRSTELLNVERTNRLVALSSGGRVGIGDLLIWFVVGITLFFVGGFGARVLGLLRIPWKRARFRCAPSYIRALLVWAVVIGLGLTLFTSLTQVGIPNSYNNSVWFFVSTKFGAWLLAVEVIVAMLISGRRRLAVGCCAAVVILSLPSAVQFFVEERKFVSETVANRQADALRSLDRRCDNGEVVLTDPAISRATLYITRCHPRGIPLPGFVIFTAEQQQEEVDTVTTFWSAWSGGACDRRAFEKLDPEYVLVDTDVQGPSIPCDDLRVVERSGSYAILLRRSS